MGQPAFWYKKASLLRWIFAPLGYIYAYFVRRRLSKTKPYQPRVPVICVGNLCVGGSGKTPVALAVADFFIKKGKKVVFLSHGYKSTRQDIVVDLKDTKGVGDEALLMAQKAPTVVNRKRADGVRRAEKMGADVIVMDDGFQNPSVVKTLSVLVFDGKYGVGNGACIPAGPMREKLSDGLKRADAVIVMGEDKIGLKEKIKKINERMPVLKGKLEPTVTLKGKKGFAFAGIGHPEKFFEMLKNNGVVLTGQKAFPDHFNYTEKTMKILMKKDDVLLTTAKDMVKIPSEFHNKIICVDVEFKPEFEGDWASLLGEK